MQIPRTNSRYHGSQKVEYFEEQTEVLGTVVMLGWRVECGSGPQGYKNVGVLALINLLRVRKNGVLGIYAEEYHDPNYLAKNLQSFLYQLLPQPNA